MAQGDTLGVVMQLDIGSGASGGVAAQAQISDVFSATAVYAVGAYVVYNGLLYRCTTAHSGAWNAAHFEQVTIGGELNTRTPVYGGGVNLLDNWYFIGGGTTGAFPVNQKGATSYNATGAICIDRWVLNQNTLSLTAAGLKANTGSSINLIQYFEDERIDDGQTYILSVLFDNGLVQGTGLLSKSQQSGSSWQMSTTNTVSSIWAGIRYDTGSSKWHLRLTCANDTRTIIAVKLELGSMQTLARQVNGSWVLNDPPPNFQQELAKCQRYFQVFRDQNLRPAYGMDFRPPMANEQPTQSSFVLDGVTYYTASAEL